MSPTTIHALDALETKKLSFASIVALFGDDRFLQLEVLRHLTTTWIGDEFGEFAVTRLDGPSAEWPDIADLLATGSLFSTAGRRLVVVDEGDEFVKRHRSALEGLASDPGSINALVLCVDSWPANTRLYKLIDKSGLQIDCNPPTTARGKSKQVDEYRINAWLIARARSNYSLELSKAAAQQLLDLSPCNFGMFDQQLAKLSCYASTGESVTPENVCEWIGGWRINTVWQAIDAAVDGDPKKAFELLNDLLRSGEHPLALFGQISWSLRRYGEALEIYDRGHREGQRLKIQDCLAPAGFRPWGGELQAAESRIKRLGPQRSRRILRWLLKADLALKGSHSHESRGRFVLEQLVARLAAPIAVAEGR
jgi:DNA polymerase-3 subunit delta